MSTHKTRGLPTETKEALEKLLGRRLAEDEEVSIWTSRPHAAPAGKAREAAWRKLNQHLDRMAAKVQGSPDDMERIADQVSDEVRHEPR